MELGDFYSLFEHKEAKIVNIVRFVRRSLSFVFIMFTTLSICFSMRSVSHICWQTAACHDRNSGFIAKYSKTLGPGTIWLDYGESCVRWNTVHVNCRVWVCRLLCELLLHLTQQVIHGPVVSILSCWNVLLGDTGVCSCCRLDHESHGISVHYYGSFAALNVTCHPKWKGSHRDEAPCVTRHKMCSIGCRDMIWNCSKRPGRLSERFLIRRSIFWVSFTASPKLKNNNFWIFRICMTASLTRNTIYLRSVTKNL